VLAGLGHLDLVCRDLERSLAFYAAVFGPGAATAGDVPRRARRADPLPALPNSSVELESLHFVGLP
jgi:hypothetical protein